MKGIKYTGIVSKRRNQTDSDRSLNDYVPIWGKLSQRENGTWCHDSNLTQLRLGDNIFLNISLKYISDSNKVKKIIKYYSRTVIGEINLELAPDMSDAFLMENGETVEKTIPTVLGNEEYYYMPQYSTEEEKNRMANIERNDLIWGPDTKGLIFP